MYKISKEELTRLLDRGLTYKEIGQATGISTSRIGVLARKWHLYRYKIIKEYSEGLEERKGSFPLGDDLYLECAAKFRRKRQNVLSGKKWEWDVQMKDIDWPITCPVLNIPLLWDNIEDRRTDASPSFDRIDRTKGFVKGNILITSWRACRLRGDGTKEEHEKIANYFNGKH